MDKDLIVRQSTVIEKVQGKHHALPKTRAGWIITGATGMISFFFCLSAHFDGGTVLFGLFATGIASGFSDDTVHALFYGKRFPAHLAMSNNKPIGDRFQEACADFAYRWLGFERPDDPRDGFKARFAKMCGMPEPDYDDYDDEVLKEADEEDESDVIPMGPAKGKQDTSSGYDLLVANNGSNDILLGHDKDGKEIRRTWKQLKAILILGLQGGGKTSSAVWLMSQALMQGARLAVIDKHAKSEEDSLIQKIEPFRPFFDCSPGIDPVSAWQVARHVRKVFNARLDGAPCIYPLLLVIDEFSAIMRQIKEDGSKWQEVAKELASLIEALNEEGRKHKVYAVCIGQATNASRSGGTEVRDLFNTRVAHGMREKQAEMLSLTDYKKAIRALEVGQALVDMEGRDEPFFLQVPYLTGEDIKALAEFLRANNVKASGLPMGDNAVMDAVIAALKNLDKKDLMSLIEQMPDRDSDSDFDEGEDKGEDEEGGEDLPTTGRIVQYPPMKASVRHESEDARKVKLAYRYWQEGHSSVRKLEAVSGWSNGETRRIIKLMKEQDLIERS